MVEFEESLQQCYLFIKLHAGFEVRRAELTRRVLAGDVLLSWRAPVDSVSDTGLASL